MKTREEKFARILSIANLISESSFEKGAPTIEQRYRTNLTMDPARTLALLHRDLIDRSYKWGKKEWLLYEVFAEEFAELDLEDLNDKNLDADFYIHLSKAKVRAMDSVMSATEAEEKWNLKPGTVRASCTRGNLKDHKGVRKSGNTWLVTVSAMEDAYGDIK